MPVYITPPPLAYRVVFEFEQSGLGSREVYYTPTVNAPGAAPFINSLITARNQCLPNNVEWQGVRISQYGVPRTSQLILPPSAFWYAAGVKIIVPSAGAFPADAAAHTEGPFRLCLQEEVTYGLGRSTNHYIGPLPNSIIGSEPTTLNLENDPKFKTNLQAFNRMLINNWQVSQLAGPPPAPFYTAVKVIQGPAPSLLLGIVVGPTPAINFVTGQRLALTKFRAPKGTRQPTINGTWICDSVDLISQAPNQVVYLSNSGTVQPSQVRLTGLSGLFPKLLTLGPIQLIYPKRVLWHKRGKAPEAPRGRRLTHGSLDP